MLRTIVAPPLAGRLAAIIAKATAPGPATRYPDASELAADIALYLDGQPVNAYRESVLERLGRWLERNRALVAGVVAHLPLRGIARLACPPSKILIRCLMGVSVDAKGQKMQLAF